MSILTNVRACNRQFHNTYSLSYFTNKNKGMCQITAQKKDIHYRTTSVCNTTQQSQQLRLTLLYV